LAFEILAIRWSTRRAWEVDCDVRKSYLVIRRQTGRFIVVIDKQALGR